MQLKFPVEDTRNHVKDMRTHKSNLEDSVLSTVSLEVTSNAANLLAPKGESTGHL